MYDITLKSLPTPALRATITRLQAKADEASQLNPAMVRVWAGLKAQAVKELRERRAEGPDQQGVGA